MAIECQCSWDDSRLIWLMAIECQCSWDDSRLIWLMAIECHCNWDDSRPEWLMAIECQCSWDDSRPAWLIGYRASVWSGSASYTVVSPNRLVYSQRFPLPPTPLFSFVFFPRVQLLNSLSTFFRDSFVL